MYIIYIYTFPKSKEFPIPINNRNKFQHWSIFYPSLLQFHTEPYLFYRHRLLSLYNRIY